MRNKEYNLQIYVIYFQGQQTIDVYIEDDGGRVAQKSFTFADGSKKDDSNGDNKEDRGNRGGGYNRNSGGGYGNRC
jgi:hypothetical protein